jgi:putative ABC transport system permease protein
LLTRALRSMVYEVSVTDPASFLAAPAFLLLVALFATLFPAQRAAGVDPAIALRRE